MSHNELLHPSCNIDTDAHLLFTKALRSELQECLGKVLFTLEFLQLHPIVILVCNEWFGWIHTIWVCFGNTLLFSFRNFILPHPSPIILLLRSCHLYRAFFLWSNELLPTIRISFYRYISRTTCYQAIPLVTFRMNY